jgi:hypothetical protein
VARKLRDRLGQKGAEMRGRLHSHQVATIGAAEKKPVKLATITSKVLKIARATLFPPKAGVEPSPPPASSP